MSKRVKNICELRVTRIKVILRRKQRQTQEKVIQIKDFIEMFRCQR